MLGYIHLSFVQAILESPEDVYSMCDYLFIVDNLAKLRKGSDSARHARTYHLHPRRAIRAYVVPRIGAIYSKGEKKNDD